ncbi:MobF family relaxase [Gloeocapsa sp. BRSZ]
MLSISTINSGTREQEEYYSEDESLSESEDEADDLQDEYYSEAETRRCSQELIQAVWHGRGAKKLGLEGKVDKEVFKDVFYGFKPGREEQIRGEKPNSSSQERLGHDLTFSAPKSVSIALYVGSDTQLFDAHMEAVKEVLDEVEQRYAQVRIQITGDRRVTNTDNLTIALIPHHTSRDGDMQLHTHAFVMNGSQGPDGVWRALWHESLVNAQWLGSLYRQKLAHKVQKLGYEIYETKDGFELTGITREDIEVFSKRSRSIVNKLKQDGLEVNSENRDRATLLTRKAKQITQTLEQLQQGWKAEAEAMGIKVPLPGKSPLKFLGSKPASEELDSAIAHLSQRSVSFSVENIYQYVFARLQSFSLDELDLEIKQHSSLIRTRFCRFTTVKALEREIETVQRWMSGQSGAQALVEAPLLEQTELNSGQAEAVRRFLTSHDKHQIIHGLSGVGKTRALGEIKRQMEGSAIDIRGFAPTIEAAAQLQKELRINTNTVARLVLSQPDFSPNQLWIVDEAGMVSATQMLEIQRQADATGARILLVGDKGQNSSVEAGSPLRSLIAHGGTTHSISQIIRQQNSLQRQAVELIANGDSRAALELLSQNGYVTEVADRASRVKEIANQYLALSEKERALTLIVTGTNTERLAITKELRSGLKREGSLESSGIKTVQLVSRQFTYEQARRANNYQVGDYIRLRREYKGTPLNKNQLYKVEQVDGDTLVVSSYGGRIYRFSPKQYKEKEVFYAQEIEIAVGDRLRWTASDKSKEQINGQIFTVTAIEGTTLRIVDKKGITRNISLTQPLAVDYDLVSTSYRAQGKTAKRVIVSATSDPTSSREPFYVKISRQTQELSIYTQDLQQLEKWVKRSNAQENPSELLGENYDGRHSQAIEPDGTTDQLDRQPVQSDSSDYSRGIERLCDEVNRTAIRKTIGELGRVIEGLNRVNQQCCRGVENLDNLAREIGKLNQQPGNADRGIDRAEERLAVAIQQWQTAELIEQPLLRLSDALNNAKSIDSVEAKPLIELAQTLQQSIIQSKEKAAQTIRNEKLNLLADAIALGAGLRPIAQWRVEQASVGVGQTRAEERIYDALHNFERSLNQGIASFKANSQQVNATLSELHSLLSQKSAPLRAPGSTAANNCPAHIDPKHWREWAEDSCIHPALAAVRLQTIYGNGVYDRLLSEKLATMGSGQYVTKPMARVMKTYQQLAEYGGWWVDSGVDPRSFPLLKAGEKPVFSLYGTFKPNNPRVDADGKIRKYENPLGLKQKLFERDLNFSAVPDEIAEQIYRKYNVVPTAAEKAAGFWYVVYKHPEIPIYRTEGNKKDAAITSLGCVAISGQGVNAGYKAKDQFGNRLPRRVLHPQLEVFAQPGREIRFVFDQDTKLSTILNVRQDLVREAELLKARGSNVYCLSWDASRGKGIDDLIRNYGASAFVQADRQAVRVEQVMKQHYRTKYNATAKQVRARLSNISQTRIDLEVYVRTIDKGYIEDATRFITESDTARYLRKQSPEAARQYVEAIASMAGTYKRLADRNVEDLDNWVEKVVQQQIVALNLKDKPTTLRNFQTKKPQL